MFYCICPLRNCFQLVCRCWGVTAKAAEVEAGIKPSALKHRDALCKITCSFSDSCLEFKHDQEKMETVLQQSRDKTVSQALAFPLNRYPAHYRCSDLRGIALLKEWLNGGEFLLP